MEPTHGQRRRHEILTTAVDLSSAEGLSELSIGRLADEIGISKSGLFAHFGSKQELQLASVRHAAEAYVRDVLQPAEEAEPGVARLRALMQYWTDSVERTSNRGGCFFDAASTEFGSRPGPVKDLLADLSRRWLRRLAQEARLAVRLRELRPDTDPELLAFQLHACITEANWARELFDDDAYFRRAKRAVADILGAACVGAKSRPPRRRDSR